MRNAMPEVEKFDRKVGIKRGHGQAPHDRYILHYRPGIELPVAWKEFVAELQGEAYQSCLRKNARTAEIHPDDGMVRAWQGCSVSPHCDARRKSATHIFYFNTEEDWEHDWGGRILMLDDEGRFQPHSAPEFEDLKVAASLMPRGNGACYFSERSTRGTAYGRSNAHRTACENCSSLPSTCRQSRYGGGGFAAKTRMGIGERHKSPAAGDVAPEAGKSARHSPLEKQPAMNIEDPTAKKVTLLYVSH